jgi:hypothetical protein
MFGELDDPQGVPERDIDSVKTAARRQRNQRRALAFAVAVVALAVPIAAIALSGDSDRPIETAANEAVSTSTTELAPTTSGEPAALDVLETTTTTESPTTTTTAAPPRPTTTTTTTTTVPAHHDRSAAFEPWDPGVAGEAWADPSSETTWRIGVAMSGLQPGLKHAIYVQEDTGGAAEIRFVCEFMAAADGTGSCQGDHVTEVGPPGQVSACVVAGPSSGCRTIAYAYFVPLPGE